MRGHLFKVRAQGRFSPDFSLKEKWQSIGAARGLVEGNLWVAAAELFFWNDRGASGRQRRVPLRKRLGHRRRPHHA